MTIETGERREAERRARAAARATGAMLFEVIPSLDQEVVLHDAATAEQRLAAMAWLCRRAWTASGRPMPTCARSELPGEVFLIEHGAPRRAP